ncbi:MAG: hypothetical protein U0U70_05190 [Chitinophagaceae bacterium]
MEKKTSTPSLNRSAVFDWSVITLSFVLSFVFPALKDLVNSGLFSVLMMVALALYTAGAWLKNLPLRYRMTTGGETPRDVPYLIFMLAGHFVIILMLALFAEPAIRKIFFLPSPPAGKADDQAGVLALIDTVISIFVTWIVFSTKKKRKMKKVYDARYLYWREVVADIFLAGGVGILTFIFWEKAIIGMAGNQPISSLSDVWYLFILLACCFMFFYLPLRYLFLIEDHTSNQTWKRFLIIFGFVLMRSLFYMLRI